MEQKSKTGSPLSAKEILEMSFLENRARLLEIAAFLDRIDRAADADEVRSDYRYRAFTAGVGLLSGQAAQVRTAAIQINFSDPTTEPLADAVGLKAYGAWNGDGKCK